MWLLRLRKILKSLGREGLVLLWAIRNPATPGFVKLGTALLLLYVISPFDLIPDIPLVGWLDDAALLMLAVPWLLGRLPAQVRHDAAAAIERLMGRFGRRAAY